MFLRLVLEAVLITAICRLFDSHFLFSNMMILSGRTQKMIKFHNVIGYECFIQQKHSCKNICS